MRVELNLKYESDKENLTRSIFAKVDQRGLVFVDSHLTG